MRNKVLVVDSNREEKEKIEEILHDIIQEGGEIFFAYKREDALSILKKELPQLVFLDSSFIGENEDEWVVNGVHIIVMRPKNAPHQKSEDCLIKPLKRHQVLEKCQELLSREPANPMPPM